MKTLIYVTGSAVSLVSSLAVGTMQHRVLAGSLCLAGLADVVRGVVSFAIELAAQGCLAGSGVMAETLASETLCGWPVRLKVGNTEPNPSNHHTLGNTRLALSFGGHCKNHRAGLLQGPRGH